MSKYAAVNVKFGADISQFSTAMQNAARQMKKAGDQLQSVGRSMTMNLTAPIVALGAAALYSFGQIDSLKRGLISFSGSAQLAEEEFNKLREVAKLPGVGLEEAVRGSINLQAIGISADDARKAMMAFGNAIATVGGGKENFDLAIRGFSQLTNASKPLQQDLYQIANQLPQVNKLMIEAFGTNRAEDLAKLGLSGKQLADFLVTELGKLPKVSGGIKNSFENMSDSVKISLASLGETIEKNFNISGKIDALADALSRLVGWFKDLDVEVQRFIIGITAAVAVIGPLLFALGGLAKIWPVIISGFAVISSVFLPEIAVLVAAGMYLYANWNAIGDRFNNLFASMAHAVLGSVKAMVNALDWLFSAFNISTFSAMGAVLDSFTAKLPKSKDAAEFLSFGASIKKVFKDIAGSSVSGGGGIGIGDTSTKGGKTDLPLVIDSEKTIKEPIQEAVKEIEIGYEYMDQSARRGLETLDHTFSEAENILPSRFDTIRQRTKEGFDAWAATIEEKSNQLAGILVSGMENMMVDLLVSLGAGFANKDPFNDLGLVLLDSIGKVMMQLGSAMITFSSLFAAFKKAIQAMQPEIAIPLGIAMVAAGAALSKVASNAMNPSGGASAASGSTSSGGASGGSLILTTRLDGRDLVMSGQETSRVRRR